MPTTDNPPSAAAIRRKLRALAAVLGDRATTQHEKANAEKIKIRLERELRADAPDESRTGVMYRLGRGARELTTASSANRNWTDHAYRLGRMFRRLVK